MFTGLGLKLAGFGAAIVGVLLGILAIFKKGERSAENRISLETKDAEIDIMKKNEAIDEKIDNSSDAELRERMQRDHSSDDKGL